VIDIDAVLVDASLLPAGTVIEADLCVIGAGAAGITLAHDLARSSLDVVLLEGGGYDGSEQSQELYRGEMVTRYRGKKDDKYVETTRLRYFGGTTGHWRGWCRPLEPIDFEERPWVPRSGWPLSAAELAPWYERACDVVQIPTFESDHGVGRTAGVRRLLLPDDPAVRTRIYHFSPPTRFGTHYREAIVGADRVRLLLNTNVLRLRATEDARAVRELEAVTAGGRSITVRARGFVLAAGGIENPRILLLSDAEQREGLGNGTDLVGRCFMDHPHVGRYGQLVFHDDGTAGRFAPLYLDREKDKAVGGKTLGVLVLSNEIRRSERLQGFSVSFRREKPARLDDLAVAVGRTGAAVDALGAPQPESPPRLTMVRMSVRAEQRPNPDSRVTLDYDVDRLGLRKVRVDWRLAEEDAASMRRSAELFCASVAAGALGRARLRVEPDAPWEHVEGGAHHIGTTRMATTPTDGVVDGDCRVHGLANLWIAGSSVFPTCGIANPTLTIVALTLRLAERLRGELRR